MRNGQNGRRRGRGNNPGGGGIPRPNMNGGARPDNHNRMEVRARGNAHQLLEKYKTLARDAHQAGDRVAAEYYMQHADHYYRVLSEGRPRQEDQRGRQTNFMDDPDPDTEFDGDGEDGGDYADGNMQPANRQQPQQQARQGEREPQGDRDRQDRQGSGQRRDQQQRYDSARDDRYDGARDRGRGNSQAYAGGDGQRDGGQAYADTGSDAAVVQDRYADEIAPERAVEPQQAVAVAPVAGSPEDAEPPRRRRGRPPRVRPAASDEDGGDIGLPDFITLDG